MSKREFALMVVGIFVLGMMAGVIIAGAVFIGTAQAEQAEDMAPLYVTASVLNGRAEPTKKARVEAYFDRGDRLTPTGRISKDRRWVEVYGGEAGTVWVFMEYVTERVAPFEMTNANNGKIKIRSRHGDFRVRGYVGHGKRIRIDQVVLGWGHCSRGWIDLDYLVEEDD